MVSGTVRHNSLKVLLRLLSAILSLGSSDEFKLVGRLVRVALVAIICDHPAMCKLCGFAEKNHKNAPCTKCKVPLSEMYSDKAICNGMPCVQDAHLPGSVM